MSAIPPNITYAGNQNIFAYANGVNNTVTSLNGLHGAVNIVAGNENLIVENENNDIYLTVNDNLIVTDLGVTSGVITLSDTIGTNTLEVVGTDLYFDGQLLAKANDIQNIADWADYPAITKLNIDNKGINNASSISLGNNTNTLSVNEGNQLLYNGDVVSTGVSGVTSLNTLSGAVGITSTNTNITIGQDEANNITLTGVGGGGDPATWSQYPATQNVNMVNYNLTSASSTGIIVDSGVNPITPTVNITASNGIAGKINITANNGFGGTSYGAIDITAYGGTTAGVTSGGSINIVSTTPSGTVGVSGKVTINGAGINSYAGASPVLGSLTGYNYIHGDASVNITAGAPPVVPNDPLTVYLYGTNGTLMYGTQYMGKIRPYSDLTINPTDLRIEKYSNLITTGYIVIDGCKTLNMEPTATLSVSNGTGTDGQVLGKSGGNLAWVAGGGTPTEINQASSFVSVSTVGNIALDNTLYSGEGIPTIIAHSIGEIEFNAGGVTTPTQIIKLDPADNTPPPLGLYVSPTQLYFNGSDVLASSGVSSLNTLTGIINLASSDNTIDITAFEGSINLQANIKTVIGATGTTALTNINKNTTYIFTSGTIQNFTTADLGTGDAGLIWYVKNAKASVDITIEHLGTAISGFSTLHARTTNNNSSIQIIYWSGTDLFMY